MSRKMDSTGGNGIGLDWDDGAHENVKKIQISHNQRGINFVRFEYLDGTETVTGDEYGHGKISDWSPITEEFELDTDEYITEVKAYVVFVGHVGEMRMLKFKTNKQTSKAYGHEILPCTRQEKVFEERGKKIVGFYGNSGDNILHQIGVYVSPINKTTTLTQRFYHYFHQFKNKFK